MFEDQSYAELRERALYCHEHGIFDAANAGKSVSFGALAEAISTLLDRCIALEGALRECEHHATLNYADTLDTLIERARSIRGIARTTLSGTAK